MARSGGRKALTCPSLAKYIRPSLVLSMTTLQRASSVGSGKLGAWLKGFCDKPVPQTVTASPAVKLVGIGCNVPVKTGVIAEITAGLIAAVTVTATVLEAIFCPSPTTLT